MFYVEYDLVDCKSRFSEQGRLSHHQIFNTSNFSSFCSNKQKAARASPQDYFTLKSNHFSFKPSHVTDGDKLEVAKF